MKIRNYDSFFSFALLLSGDIQLNPGPTSDICFICKGTLNKKSFYCTKCDLRAHKKCSNTVFSDSDNFQKKLCKEILLSQEHTFQFF